MSILLYGLAWLDLAWRVLVYFTFTLQARLFAKIKKGIYSFHDEYWLDISKEAKDLISRMLTVDPSKRITAKEALEHPYLKACIFILILVLLYVVRQVRVNTEYQKSLRTFSKVKSHP